MAGVRLNLPATAYRVPELLDDEGQRTEASVKFTETLREAGFTAGANVANTLVRIETRPDPIRADDEALHGRRTIVHLAYPGDMLVVLDHPSGATREVQVFTREKYQELRQALRSEEEGAPEDG